MADRSMSMVPVAFSLMASFMSAITLLGVVQEMYMYGTQFIIINIAYIIATPVVCYFYLPVFFRLQKTSVYEVSSIASYCPLHMLGNGVALVWNDDTLWNLVLFATLLAYLVF